MYFQIIMPVGADPQWAEKVELARGAAESRGIGSHLPQYPSEDGSAFNLRASLEDLRGAEFVVADLSLERPSCYYELGLAEALGKRVFLLAEEGTHIHQASARQSVRFFKGLGGFKSAIESILDEALLSAASTAR